MVIPELYIRKKWLSTVAKMNLKDQFKQTWNTYDRVSLDQKWNMS
jgi:hypothetical protein